MVLEWYWMQFFRFIGWTQVMYCCCCWGCSPVWHSETMVCWATGCDYCYYLYCCDGCGDGVSDGRSGSYRRWHRLLGHRHQSYGSSSVLSTQRMTCDVTRDWPLVLTQISMNLLIRKKKIVWNFNYEEYINHKTSPSDQT